MYGSNADEGIYLHHKLYVTLTNVCVTLCVCVYMTNMCVCYSVYMTNVCVLQCVRDCLSVCVSGRVCVCRVPVRL